MTSRRLAAVLLVAMLASVPPAHAAGAERGQQVFAVECSDCHSVAEGKNKRGPSLFGVYGRRAATAPGFSNYSDALRNSGIVWDAAALQRYLADPRAMVPGGKMKYDGLASAADREALVVWLARQGR